VLAVPQPFTNHNGGQLAFGPNDGYLDTGLGDGGLYEIQSRYWVYLPVVFQ
jgi:hypothetical protein